jgi:predicted GIY-YIG superfamily endonuclease
MDLKECKLIDNQDRECGVYAIYNTENNKIYVGSSVDVYNRVYLEHIKLLNSNKHYNKYLQDAYNKDKESFIFVLIENIIDKNKLIERAILDGFIYFL